MFKGPLDTIAGLPAVFSLFRHWTRYRPRILMYHGLTRNPDNLDWTQVQLSDFSVQMKEIKKHFYPVSLKSMVSMLESGNIEPDAVVITFDDGYKSNHDLAWPILKKLEIPATIFITAGFLLQHECCRPYLWPDFITTLTKSYRQEVLDLDEFGLGQYNLTSSHDISKSRDSICDYLKSIASEKREEIIRALKDRFGDMIDHDHFADYRPMNEGEMRNMAADDLITIGAHSMTHPILSRQNAEKLEDEIGGSKIELEKITGNAIDEFAYPNGRWQDINRRAIDITARDFNCAVTTEAGLNRPGDSKYLLLRLGIGSNLNLKQFRAILSGVYYIWQRAKGLEAV